MRLLPLCIASLLFASAGSVLAPPALALMKGGGGGGLTSCGQGEDKNCTSGPPPVCRCRPCAKAKKCAVTTQKPAGKTLSATPVKIQPTMQSGGGSRGKR
jgi:hypothetical protein